METTQGNERLFDPEDVFFSTTDRKGVIRNANRTFVTLARHPREALIGAPHNIIRHDDMPAGVFKLLWDDLEAGRPVCTYVLNRAGDGLDYWVFATVSAVEDGYVSVRTKPLEEGTFSTVREVYARVRAIERLAAQEGASRREVAAKGAQALLAELEGLGFASLSSFSMAALPAEAIRLAGAGVKVPAREEVEGPAATVLAGARRIEWASASLVGQTDGYRRLLEGLGAWMEAAPAISERAERIRAIVGTMDSQDGESFAPTAAQRVVERTGDALGRLSGLTDAVATLYENIRALSFQASLMRLHTQVLGSYSATAVDGVEESIAGAMTELHRALSADTGTLDGVCREVETSSESLAEAMQTVVSGLDRTRRPLDRWVRAMRDEGATLREGVEGEAEALLGEAEALEANGFPEMSALANLTGQCRGLDLSYDSAALVSAEAAIVDAIGQME